MFSFAPALRALQSTIRSVRILSGEHIVHHTKRIATPGRPAAVHFVGAPRHSLPFEATVAVRPDERGCTGAPWSHRVLSAQSVAHVQRALETAGCCGPCSLVTCVPRAPGAAQMEHIFAFDKLAHAELAARRFTRLRLPVEDGYAIVRLTRGRWRRRRRLLRHQEAPM